MRIRKVLRKLVLTFGLLAVLTALLWPREKLLLGQAQKLPISSEAYPNEPGAWTSENTQLILDALPDGKNYGVFTRDMTTGHKTPLQAFNAARASFLQRKPTSSRVLSAQASWPLPHAFSPDRKWLLWQAQIGKTNTWDAASLDGKQVREWDNTPESGFQRDVYRWLGDGRHWAMLGYDPEFYLHRISIFSLDDPKGRINKTFANRGSRWPIGITPDNHLLSYEPYVPPAFPSLTFYDTALDEARPTSRKITVPLPPGMRANRLSVSPDGTRLLWNLHAEPRLPGSPWMQTLCRKMGMKPRAQEALWISRRDGSGLHEIAHLSLDPPPPPSPLANVNRLAARMQAVQQAFLDTPRVYGAQWLPDNKQVLFMYKEGVYKLTVD